MSEFYTLGGDTYQDIWAYTPIGQTFRPRWDHDILYFDANIRCGDTRSNIYVRIYYADAHHEPHGEILSAGNITFGKEYQNGFTYKMRCKMTPWKLTAGEYYAIILDTPIIHFPVKNAWLYDKDDATYPRGLRISSPDGGITWTKHYNDDHIFVEWGNPPLSKPDPPPPIQHFAPQGITYIHGPTDIFVILETAVPCHLTCYYTDTKPLKHATFAIVRGLEVPWDTYFCFVTWKTLEQTEPGDTFYHTFYFTEWPHCFMGYLPPPTPPETLPNSYFGQIQSDQDCASLGWDTDHWYFFPAAVDCDLGYGSPAINKQGTSLRFLNVDIEPKTPIRSAYLRLTAFANYDVDTIRSYIRGEKSLIPNPFTTYADYLSRPKTTTKIDWSNIEHWVVNKQYATVDISPIIQEIIDQPGWSAGNPIAIFYTDEDDRSDHVPVCMRHAFAYSVAPDQAPVLSINYPSYQPIQTGGRWFTFKGEVDSIQSPSIGPIFQHCHPGYLLPSKFESYEDAPNSWLPIYGSGWRGQTFTPQQDHYLTELSLHVRKAGVSWPTLYIRIYFAPNHIPIGPPLASASIPFSALSFHPGAWIHNIKLTPCLLQKDTIYAIVLSSDASSASRGFWSSVYPNPLYSRGLMIYSPDSGSTWVQSSLWDCLFQEFGYV